LTPVAGGIPFLDYESVDLVHAGKGNDTVQTQVFNHLTIVVGRGTLRRSTGQETQVPQNPCPKRWLVSVPGFVSQLSNTECIVRRGLLLTFFPILDRETDNDGRIWRVK